MKRTELYEEYRSLLLAGIVPFWFKFGIDWQDGGVLSCMTDDGVQLSGDKYIWSQARSIWTFSALYNRIEKKHEFLAVAENSLRFLLEHGRDEEGRYVYHTGRRGEVIEGAISIYSDCFAVYGLSEYCRAVPDQQLLALTQSTYNSIRERLANPSFSETAPYALSPKRKVHAIPMIMTEITNELAQTVKDRALDRLADEYVGCVMKHVRPEDGLLVEFLGDEYQTLPPPEGTYVMPGHAIESMWFVLHVARRRSKRELVRKAAEIIRRHLEAGWDREWGGIFLGIDTEGNEPYLPHADMKVWWPHTEALYALLLTYHLTGEKWCLEWYDRVHEWSFAHFPLRGAGEWRQRLDRKGNPSEKVVALPVKDPFHLPRALILILQLLEEQTAFISGI